MFQRKAFWVITAAAIVAVLVYRGSATPVEQAGPPPSRIALITGGPGDYWQAAIAGAEAAAKELGIELEVRQPATAESVEEQMKFLSVVGSADIDAVAISPIDPERQSVLITQVAGMKPVVTFDSDASGSARQGYVGTSNFSAGLVAGTLIKKSLPGGGKVAVLLANETKENLIDRLAGLKTRLAESPVPEESATDPRFKLVGVYTDQGDNEACKQRVESLLEEHPDIACLVTLNSRQGPVVLETLKSLGAIDRVKMIAFDTPSETLDGVEQGHIYAAIAQDPFSYGYEAIGMLDSLCRGDRQFLPVVGRAAIHISVEPVTKESVAEFRDRLSARTKPTKKES